MSSTAGGLAGVAMLLIVIFLLFLAVLWFILPFLIMGTNKRLDKIIQQNDKSRLEKLIQQEQAARQNNPAS